MIAVEPCSQRRTFTGLQRDACTGRVDRFAPVQFDHFEPADFDHFEPADFDRSLPADFDHFEHANFDRVSRRRRPPCSEHLTSSDRNF